MNEYQKNNVRLSQGDCMDLMKDTPDNYYDLAIVDPPYGIGVNNQSQGKGGGVAKKIEYTKKEWDNAIPKAEYFTELKRVSKNQIVWGGNYFVEHLENSPCWIVWDKDNGDTDFADCELAWSSFKTSVRKIKWKWAGMLQQNMADKETRIHPTQKPVKLYEWLLMNYATCKTCNNEGGYYEDVAGDGGSQMWQHCDDCDGVKPKIFDTHLGSGSSAIAAHKMHFDFTGIELDQEYYQAAVKRFKQTTSQLSLI